jgi:hypothetical protein
VRPTTRSIAAAVDGPRPRASVGVCRCGAPPPPEGALCRTIAGAALGGPNRSRHTSVFGQRNSGCLQWLGRNTADCDPLSPTALVDADRHQTLSARIRRSDRRLARHPMSVVRGVGVKRAVSWRCVGTRPLCSYRYIAPVQRLRMVDRVLEHGWSIRTAAEAAEVSERTCSKWLARYREEGELGLLDRFSTPENQRTLRVSSTGSSMTRRWLG